MALPNSGDITRGVQPSSGYAPVAGSVTPSPVSVQIPPVSHYAQSSSSAAFHPLPVESPAAAPHVAVAPVQQAGVPVHVTQSPAQHVQQPAARLLPSPRGMVKQQASPGTPQLLSRQVLIPQPVVQQPIAQQHNPQQLQQQHMHQQSQQQQQPQPQQQQQVLPGSMGGAIRAASKPVSVTDTCARLLKDRAQLKQAVMSVFKTTADHRDQIDIDGLHRFRVLLSQTLGVPEAAFGDLLTEFHRFDFDSSGALSVDEAYKLVKFHLWEYWKKVGGAVSNFSIPTKSLADAGYLVTKELGKGSQAVVKQCTDRVGTVRCLKCFRKDMVKGAVLEDLIEEYEAMRLLGCKRIAQTFEIFQDVQFFYIVNEMYYGGDFLTLKTRALEQGVQMTEDWWRKIFKQCLRALEFMQTNAMVHCDIKEANLMVKFADYHKPEVCVVDFGVAKAMGSSDHGIGGTPGYMPPETIEVQKWFPAGDMFSLGVVMFQLTSDIGPGAFGEAKPGLFTEDCPTIKEVMLATMSRQPNFAMMPAYWPLLVSLTKSLLEKKLADRPRAPKALAHDWFTIISQGGAGDRVVSNLPANPRVSEPLVSLHPLATAGIVAASSQDPALRAAPLHPKLQHK